MAEITKQGVTMSALRTRTLAIIAAFLWSVVILVGACASGAITVYDSSMNAGVTLLWGHMGCEWRGVPGCWFGNNN